ncbi:unnamed protein product [Ambrosiozyma monospora]|uniref:Unnamed protein product n=1 Tax=Ambrosiozyma monospora TaxID=43982 RepID=A0ACB5TX62_AMBMO|nr:unnamed protein product [Ambrosiozyma monospora]
MAKSGLSVGSLPSIKQFWGQAVFLAVLGITTAYFVKSNVTIRRRQQYIQEASNFDTLQQERTKAQAEKLIGDSNDSDEARAAYERKYGIRGVQPGFPIKDENSPVYERKSEFEGAGNAYLSRKSGDKFGFWNIFK